MEGEGYFVNVECTLKTAEVSEIGDFDFVIQSHDPLNFSHKDGRKEASQDTLASQVEDPQMKDTTFAANQLKMNRYMDETVHTEDDGMIFSNGEEHEMKNGDHGSLFVKESLKFRDCDAEQYPVGYQLIDENDSVGAYLMELFENLSIEDIQEGGGEVCDSNEFIALHAFHEDHLVTDRRCKVKDALISSLVPYEVCDCFQDAPRFDNIIEGKQVTHITSNLESNACRMKSLCKLKNLNYNVENLSRDIQQAEEKPEALANKRCCCQSEKPSVTKNAIKNELNENDLGRRFQNSRLISRLLTTNSNIKQKIIYAASDTLSIKSKATSSLKNQNFKSDMTFSKLPLEIQNSIITCLIGDQRSLVNCLFVNKSINTIAMKSLYYYPRFTSTYRFAQFVTSVIINPKLGMLVRILDLSKIDYPIKLTEYEKLKFKDELIFGSMTYQELLNEQEGGINNRIILAGWRDWKFRSHPLYGMLNMRKRARGNSIGSSTVNSVHWGSDVTFNTRNSYNYKYSNSSSATLVNSNSFISGNKRNRSYSSSDLSMRSKRREIYRTNSMSTNCKDNEGDISLYGGIVSLIKKLVGVKNEKKKRRNKRGKKRKKKCKEGTNNVKESFEEENLNSRPFNEPHPRQNYFLREYTFNKDIPIGYLIHLLRICENIEELNLDYVQLSKDFEIKNYPDVDWESGLNKNEFGSKERYRGQNRSHTIFWSDIHRDFDMFEEKWEIKSFELNQVWEEVLRMERIEVLSLRGISSLEQNNIERFVMKSRFKKELRRIYCNNSGMVKRNEWECLINSSDWRRYFRSQKRNGFIA